MGCFAIATLVTVLFKTLFPCILTFVVILGVRTAYTLFFTETEFSQYIIVAASLLISLLLFFLFRIFLNLCMSIVFAFVTSYAMMMFVGVASGHYNTVTDVIL